MKIYSVSVSYESNLIREPLLFVNEKDAKKYFEQECKAARDNAENPWETDDEDSLYQIEEQREDDNDYTVSREGFKANVKLSVHEVDLEELKNKFLYR